MSELTYIAPKVITEHLYNDSVVLKLFVCEELDYFKGHFPNTPILPGVVQLHWAVEFAREKLTGFRGSVKNIEVLKFKSVIIPGQELTLTISKKTAHKFIFTYCSEKGEHASGRIVLDVDS